MNEVQEYILNLLPPDKKQKKNGSWTWNCRSCLSQGESRNDTRSRASLTINGDGLVFNCFNCKFSFGWQTGYPLSKKMIHWLKDLDVSDKQINELKSLMENQSTNNHKSITIKKKEYKKIPDEYKSFRESLKKACKNKYFIKVAEYIVKRNPELIKWTDIYWCDKQNHFLIPYYENEEQVGYCLRMLDDNVSSKYLQYCYTGYIFNNDLLKSERQNIICVEGAIDALAIDGIGLLQNYLTKDRLKVLKYYAQNKNIIILPDNDSAGKKLVEQILKENLPFGISFPHWDSDIKDAEDAVKKYGKLYTIYNILNSIEYNPIMIKVKMQQWFNYKK